MSKIKFLNHASILIEHKNTKILCDPWFKGKVFDNSWSLLYNNSHDINKIDFDYIWISHEHPDHFSIPTLKSLKEKKIFLYQKTADKKVKKFLEKFGHKVIELKNSIPIKIDHIELTSFICDGYDSSLFFKFSDGTSLLNINDARIEHNNEIKKILKIIKKSPDLICSQFSYANWAGNKGDLLTPIYQQKLVNERNLEIVKRFKPKALMLFASFIYYCHEENFYWNNSFPYKEILNSYKKINSRVIFPKTNQEINLSELLNIKNFNAKNNNSINFWKKYYKNKKITSFTKSRTFQEIEFNYLNFYENLWTLNHKNLINYNKHSSFCLKILISDLKKKIKIGLFKNTFEFINDEDEYDCSISSETLIFLFKNTFGRGTVTINSRIKFNYNSAHRFFIFFYFSYINNLGIYFSKKNKFSLKKLKSIKNTTVISSILNLNKSLNKIIETDFNQIFKNK